LHGLVACVAPKDCKIMIIIIIIMIIIIIIIIIILIIIIIIMKNTRWPAKTTCRGIKPGY
jgi:hypothetical protein